MGELVTVVSFEMDFGCKLLVLVFTLLRLSKMASSSDCFSRLEIYPCSFRFPELTQIAGRNQYGVYTTALDQNNVTGGTTCVVRKRNHRVADIPSRDNGTFFEIKSPNKYETTKSDKNYNKNLLAIYNVSCPANHFIYIIVSDMNMDDSTCHDPGSNSEKCMDYLQIRNAANTVLIEKCGNDIGKLKNYPVSESSVEIIFRTDDKRGAGGFSATVRCYNPSTCIQSQQWRPTASVETFSQSCPEAFSEKIEVPYGHNLYKVEEPEHQSLVLVEGRNIKATWPYKRPLQQLRYYSMNGRVNEFRQQVSGRGQNARDKTWFPSPLKGPGTLYLPRDSEVSRACYQDYSEIVPTKRQKQQINQISVFMRFMHEKQHYARSSGLHQSDVDSESYIKGDTVTTPLSSHSKFMNFLTSLEKVLLKHSVRKISNILKEASTSSESCNPILEAYKNMYKNTVKKIKLD